MKGQYSSSREVLDRVLGGAFYINSSSATVHLSTIADNACSFNGGNILPQLGAQSQCSGGAFAIRGSEVAVTQSNITRNTAMVSGSVIPVYYLPMFHV
jgi:hypothetical protein